MYLEILDDLHTICELRINDLNESVEIKFIFRRDWQKYDTTTEQVLRMKMREIGYGSKGSDKANLGALADAITTHADEKRYNPIKEYFNGLSGKYKPGDNGPYIIPAFAGYYFKTPNVYLNKYGTEAKLFEKWLYKWMVGTIAKLFDGERNPMLVLVGEQRKGKSYFAQWICPTSHFIKGSINPDSKDCVLRLTEALVWEVEELGSTTRRADIEALKSFITKPFIYERAPYQPHPIYKQVATSFIGTVNNDGAGFLTDPTGSSRFLACQIDEIDFSYSTKENVNDLWAEAHWFYKNVPKSWELSEEEKDIQAKVNAQFETSSALADVIEAFFDLNQAGENFLSNLDIKNVVTLHYRPGGEQQFHNELSRVLTKFGLTKGRQIINNRQYRGWFGITKKSDV
jgi:predicted P-loop ATPase